MQIIAQNELYYGIGENSEQMVFEVKKEIRNLLLHAHVVVKTIKFGYFKLFCGLRQGILLKWESHDWCDYFSSSNQKYN